ncbi:MAG: hypothetical protein OXU19_15720 [bacterium]|nr:hypothetical protein [bacterium]MDE0418577.1 hypothetical protein [bacterium]
MRKVTLIGGLPMAPEVFSRDVSQATKYGAFFVNTAHEPLLDCRAPDRVLASGHPGGAALEPRAVDPLHSEPPPVGRANVVLTPHIAGASIGAVRNAAAGFADEVCHCFSGERRLHSC